MSYRPPESYEELIKLIHDRYDDMSKSYQKIALYLTQNPNDVAVLSVNAIGAKCGIHASSFVRYAQSLGYKGFKELQAVFQRRLSTAAPGFDARVREFATFMGLLPSDTGRDLVKRVIGLGGDRVQCCDAQGRILVNGEALDEPYIIGPTTQVLFDIVVPPDSMFVMGDNRGNSRDSRFHLEQANGSVPVGNVVGRVVLVVWPFNRLATEPIPEVFGTIPPAS